MGIDSHLDLIQEAKTNRLKAESFYIYDYDAFNNCSMLKPHFDIFGKGMTHTSSRYVIHYLTKELKQRLGEIDRSRASKQEMNAFSDIFKPSLGQFDHQDIQDANNFIKKMFPYEGCSYTGEKLEKLINKANWITLVLSLRIIWSLLPDAIIPWESFRMFDTQEKTDGYSDYQSFYQQLPLFLPSHNHCCVLFEFLEIFITIFADDYFLDSYAAMDLIFTAGQICFAREEVSESIEDEDLTKLQSFYYQRGYAFHQIFMSYLRSLSKEPTFTKAAIFDTFDIDIYPPKPYRPMTQKALTLTVPMDPELDKTNYFKLISMAANATSRVYSSNHAFTKFENKFLDKFEINPHKIIENFFSKSSKNYLLKFDPNLNFENFKVNNDVTELRRCLKDGTIFENKEFISTFINDFNRYGFESQRDNGNNSEQFLTDTINLNFNSSLENVSSTPVRISKLDISEWFISAWKYETFLGYLQNTAVIKLTKTIGDCDWLIISSHGKVSSNNRYLTPPSSVQDAVDSLKVSEMGGSLDDEVVPDKKPRRKSLLPPLEMKNASKISTRVPKTPRKSAQVYRISFPSPPKDIAVYEKEIGMNPAHSFQESKTKPNMKFLRSPVDKPLPSPLIEAGRSNEERGAITPTQQIFSEAPEYPPPVLQLAENVNSMDPTTSEIVCSQLNISTPEVDDAHSILETPPAMKVLDRSSSENFEAQELSSPLIPPDINAEGHVAEHPYQNLRRSPPRLKLEDVKPEHESRPIFSSAAEPFLSESAIISRTVAESPVMPKRTISKILTHTNSFKSKISPASSPISQMFPKFLRKTSKGVELEKVPSSESMGSLAHINDGSGTDLSNQFNFIKNDMQNCRDSLNNYHSVQSLNFQSRESIPHIPYTPRALREPSHHSSKTQSSGSSTTSTENKEFSKLIDENRDSFVGDISTVSRGSNCFDTESEITQDTKNTIHGYMNLDGLMEQIKESMSADQLNGGHTSKDTIAGH
jgi:hypothetical protein